MSVAPWKINVSEVDRLTKAMQAYQGNTEETINDVLHNEAGELIQPAIIGLMPRSNVKPWNGKAPHAKDSKSLRNVNEHLSLTVTTNKKWQYLYFPDDGSNTRRHAGNQQFFARSGESVQDEVIERCVNRLTQNFEEGV